MAYAGPRETLKPSIARALHRVIEPVHAAVYFQPESKSSYEAIGLKGYWMGYFASRAGAMGPVPPEMVIATFYNFAPRKVRRAIPDAWRFCSVDRVLETRLDVARIAMERLVADADVSEAATLAETAARAAPAEGRALFAAHAALAWPDPPILRLWHATTLLREHRGDGHNTALLAEGIDGLEAHLMHAAAGLIDPARQRDYRGWSEDEWDAAAERLRARGLLDAGGAFTEAGAALKQHVEDRTDSLASQPYEAIGEPGCERLVELLAPFAGGIPYPNPIGLTPR
ncbi:MAG TPA: hypothetical protein VGB83_00820 [Actinomycetota bacterium]